MGTDGIVERAIEAARGGPPGLPPAGHASRPAPPAPGGPDPATLDDVPQRIREACAAEIDVGRLPGTPSTVIDFTRDEPYVIREGVASAAEALARVQAALAA